MRSWAIWESSTVDDVTVASRSTALVADKTVLITPSVDIWFKTAATGGSITAAANGTHLCGAYDRVRVTPKDSGHSIYYIRVGSSDGKVSISDVTE